jgi:NADH-quinone oxidoreductase subunit M
MDFFRQHILSIVAFWPLAGMFVLLLMPKENKALIRLWANLVVLSGFLVSLPLWFWFDRGASDKMQFVEKFPWIQNLGADFHVGIDGITLLLILLTTFLGPLAVLSSWSAIENRVKEYYAFMLMLQTGMLGVFVSLDFFLFYVFWEVMLVPMYFLIGVWGSDRRLYAAIKFFLYTLAGSVVMLLAILALYFYAPAAADGTRTFDIPTLLAATQNFSDPLKVWLFWGFFFAFAIKVPMFPFHTWLPDAHVEAPTAGSVILAGVLLKMGTYGFLKLGFPLFPDATRHLSSLIMTLAVVSIIYGACLALVQNDIKKIIAYSSISHLGYVMLGLISLDLIGIQGAIIQMVSHGLTAAGLFLMVGMIYERCHTRDLAAYGGLAKLLPVYSLFFMILTLASIGLPATSGFVGEFLVLLGSFNASWPQYQHGVAYPLAVSASAVAGVVLGALYMLRFAQRFLFGAAKVPHAPVVDLDGREKSILIAIAVAIFALGLYPAEPMRKSEMAAIAYRQQVAGERVPATAPKVAGDGSLPGSPR